MKVKILVTGGTFDKEYNEINGKLYFNKTHVHEILALGRSDVAVEIKTLMMVDSLDMTDQDREVLVKNISSSKEKKHCNNPWNRYYGRNRKIHKQEGY